MMFVLRHRTARIIIIAVAFITNANPLCAQKSNVYSLNDLIDSLKHFMPALLQKQALISSAKAGVTDAKHSFLPKLNAVEELSLATDNDLAGGFMPFPGVLHSISAGVTGANNFQPASSNIVSLYGEYELVNFGLRKAKINNAEAYAGLAQADYEKDLYVLKLQVSKLYFEILKNRFESGVDELNIKRYQSVYEVINALTASGIKAGVDSSLAKAELSKSRVSYNQRQGIINQLMLQMSYLTGIPASQINIDTTEKEYPDSVVASHSFKYEDNADNPLIAYYSIQQKLYQSAETLVKKSYLPKILLGAGGWARGSSIQYNDDYKSIGTGLGYQRFNYSAGIGITYDLFNGVHKNDKLVQSRYQSQAGDYALQQQRLMLQNSVLRSEESIKVAEKNLAELPLQLQAASDAYDQKVAQYKAGIINLVDLTNASFVLYTAQTSYIETLNDWFVANLEKSAATGNLDSFIQTIKK
jgi:outer membrane protein TolC